MVWYWVHRGQIHHTVRNPWPYPFNLPPVMENDWPLHRAYGNTSQSMSDCWVGSKCSLIDSHRFLPCHLWLHTVCDNWSMKNLCKAITKAMMKFWENLHFGFYTWEWKEHLPPTFDPYLEHLCLLVDSLLCKLLSLLWRAPLLSCFHSLRVHRLNPPRSCSPHHRGTFRPPLEFCHLPINCSQQIQSRTNLMPEGRKPEELHDRYLGGR